jgi:3-oxoacyl-[acyl-carrier-protein] synthase-3
VKSDKGAKTVKGVRIVGAGAFVPSRVISNARIARAIPGWSAEKIEEKTGMRERRFLWDFDTEKGQAIPPPPDADLYPACNVDMCEVALVKALEMAGLEARELDAIFLVCCTTDRLNFSHDAMALHQRLGCRSDAFAFVLDDGCGGTPYTLDMARKMIAGGTFKTIAVLGSAFVSPLMNRDVYTAEISPEEGAKALNAYLSMYVFGDGAGAVVLRGGGGPDQGILASFSGNAYDELVLRRGGGALKHAHQGHGNSVDMAYVVDGPKVARSYPEYMNRCLEAVLADTPELASEVKRYYFHQPNKRLLDHFVRVAGLPAERVACQVDRYGNTSAAGMFIALAEDLEHGRVHLDSGDLVLIAAVGANVHYGAQLVRL